MLIRDGLGICGFFRHEVTTNIVGDLAACLINYVVIRNLKTQLLTQKNRLKWRFFLYRWSEWRDLNPRHPAPKAGALPTALHPVIMLFHPAGRILPNHPRYQLRYTRIRLFCFLLSVVIYVVKAGSWPCFAVGENPASAGVARSCAVCPGLSWMKSSPLPNKGNEFLIFLRKSLGREIAKNGGKD